MATLEKGYLKLKVIPMASTEYKQNTYGFRTLDKRGGLHLYEVPGVGHRCWVVDATPVGAKLPCQFQPVFEKHLYPLLAPLLTASSSDKQALRQHG